MTDNEGISIDQANDILKRVGIRKTFSRINLLQFLSQQSSPLTHADISHQLSPLGFDASTVFRGLSDLVSANVIIRHDFGDRIWRFELRDDVLNDAFQTPQHSHAVCQSCSQIICVDLPEHRNRLENLKDWHIEEVLLKGICPDCQKAKINHRGQNAG